MYDTIGSALETGLGRKPEEVSRGPKEVCMEVVGYLGGFLEVTPVASCKLSANLAC